MFWGLPNFRRAFRTVYVENIPDYGLANNASLGILENKASRTEYGFWSLGQFKFGSIGFVVTTNGVYSDKTRNYIF